MTQAETRLPLESPSVEHIAGKLVEKLRAKHVAERPTCQPAPASPIAPTRLDPGGRFGLPAADCHADPRRCSMPRPPSSTGTWPRLMRAETASRYVDEKSVGAFRRAVGTIYPEPRRLAGKGDRWLKDDLDRAIDRLAGPAEIIRDIADVL
jgi:hypothetical protein